MENKQEIITAAQYADKLEISAAIVTKRLQMNNTLPEIVKAEKWGNTWRIFLNGNFDIEKARSQFDLRKQKNKKH